MMSGPSLLRLDLCLQTLIRIHQLTVKQPKSTIQTKMSMRDAWRKLLINRLNDLQIIDYSLYLLINTYHIYTIFIIIGKIMKGRFVKYVGCNIESFFTIIIHSKRIIILLETYFSISRLRVGNHITN